MARTDADREDLMREASALRYRIEFAVPGEQDSIVAGFHREGGLSLYFGSDPALHFNAEHELRRVFYDGRLYRAQGQTMARLTRVRTPTETEMQRHDLSPAELLEFLEMMNTRLARLIYALQAGSVQIASQIPPDADLLPRVLHAAELAVQPAIRLAAAIKP